MKLLKTGIAGFDEFLQGGLYPGVYILQGAPGSGNEIFARQVAYTRAKQNSVTYITINKTPETIKEDMNNYGWDTTPLEKTQNWKFMNLTKIESLINAITQEIKQDKCTIIDSLSELFLTHNIDEVITLLNTMSTQNREHQQIHLILLTEGMQDQKTETTTQHFADGVINFTTTWETETASRNIRITKTKGTHIPPRRLPYSIGKKGLTIETAIRIT